MSNFLPTFAMSAKFCGEADVANTDPLDFSKIKFAKSSSIFCAKATIAGSITCLAKSLNSKDACCEVILTDTSLNLSNLTVTPCSVKSCAEIEPAKSFAINSAGLRTVIVSPTLTNSFA